MAQATSVEITAAAKRAATWGTPVVCGTGDGVLLRSHGLKKDRPALLDDSLGRLFAVEADPGQVKVEGDISAYLRYDGLDLLLALAMGETAGAPVQQDTTAAYAQTFTLGDGLDGLFATFALDNGVNVDEYPSVKLTGFTLKSEVGKPLEVAFHAVADDRTVGSAINTQASFGSVTYFETSHRVLMGQGEFLMNDRDGLALGSGDEIYPASFELSYKRKLEGVYGAGGGTDTIDEPAQAGQPEVSLKLEFPRYTSKAHFTDWDASTPKKLSIAFTGALIEDVYYRTLTLSFPNLAYQGADLPVQEGILKHPVEFLCLGADTAPAGMDGITRPFQLDVMNRQSADVLA